MTDPSALLVAGSAIAGFGAVILTFRLQREVQLMDNSATAWIPWADRLVIGAVLLSLVGTMLPLVALASPVDLAVRLAAAACAASCVLLAGFVPAVLAHYRFIFGQHRGLRVNPEPAERWIVIGAAAASTAVFYAVVFKVV